MTGGTSNSRALRYLASATAGIIGLYTLALANGVAGASPLFTPLIAVPVLLAWGASLLAVMSYRPIHKRGKFLIVAILHSYAVIYLLLVASAAAPVVIFWSVLVLLSYYLFARRGAYVSIALLVVTFLADSFLFRHPIAFTLENTPILLITIVVSGAMIYLRRTEKTSKPAHRTSELQHRQDSFVTLINNMAEAIITTDKNGIIKRYNAATLDLLDTNSALDGKSVDEVFRLRDHEHTTVSLSKLLSATNSVVRNDNLTMPLSDDEAMRLEITYAPIRSAHASAAKKNDGYLLIARDITKAKSLEEERDEFISVVSHELRTPIAITEGTISNAQLVLEKHADQSTLESSLKTAHDQIIFLASMVNDLSTLSRAERGVADAAELIDVNDLGHQLFNEYARDAETKGLTFDLDISPKTSTISASRLYLHELLQNFITNSIKYTREGSILLRIKHQQDHILFEVKDTGIGISKSDRDKIFDKFYRSEDYRTRETSGTGIGLYVAVKLAHKLGCKIDVKSRLNHGSSFSFTLPVTTKSKS